jgi:hypothetical protein
LFLGSTSVSTDASGNAAFEFITPSIEQQGRSVTATAADAAGNTSEFSACATVTSSGTVVGDANGDGQVNVDDLIAVILGWGSCPPAPATCPADVNHDGSVDVDDLIMVILNWG